MWTPNHQEQRLHKYKCMYAVTDQVSIDEDYIKSEMIHKLAQDILSDVKLNHDYHAYNGTTEYYADVYASGHPGAFNYQTSNFKVQDIIISDAELTEAVLNTFPEKFL